MPIVELTQQVVLVGGDAVIVDDELSSTSTNAVQNKVIKEELDVIKEELDGKAPNEHTHRYEDLTEKMKWIELE